MAITEFGQGIYSGNAAGHTFLSKLTTAANFTGPPLVAVLKGVDLAGDPTDPTALLLVDFADGFGGPLVFFDVHDPEVQAYAILSAAVFSYAYIFDTAQARTPVFSGRNGHPQVLEPLGPLIAAGTTQDDVDDGVAQAWATAGQYNRISQYHPYGAGMQAVSIFDGQGELCPPVYRAGPGSVSGDLTKLGKIWRGQAVTTRAQYAAVLAAAVARPGLARLVNAALVPFVQLTTP